MEAGWERGWVELAHAPEIRWEPMPGEAWPVGVQARVLSRDEATGAFTGVVELPPGYRRGPGFYQGETEFYVLAGSLRIGDVLRGRGYYRYDPPGGAQPEWISDEGAEILFMARTSAPDFQPGSGQALDDDRIEIDVERLPWQVTPVEGPPPGICFKLLRAVEATGGFTALVSNVPRFDYPMLEFHDCIEEIYCVSGDIWLGNSGQMTSGSYLWRPPFITHGPFYSESGAILFLWVDEPLINHFVDDPRSTREDNRRQRDSGGPSGGS
jgi:hypothetical protein